MQPENKRPNRVAMMLIMAIDHTWDGGDDDDDTGDGGGGSNYLLPSLPCHSALPLWEHVRRTELRKMMTMTMMLMLMTMINLSLN